MVTLTDPKQAKIRPPVEKTNLGDAVIRLPKHPLETGFSIIRNGHAPMRS